MFELLATYRNRGGVFNALVGPGPAAGSERLYQSYCYIGGSLEIVATDPENGEVQVFPSPVPGESGAWALTAGPDGNLYVGTLPHAHILRLDPGRGTLTDAGRPAESESYIWQLALGSDKRLYGCTYPSAKLVRFDPATGQGEDLGRMDPTELYARHVAADDAGFVYVGIGTSRSQIVAYEIATGTHRPVLPERYRVTGTAVVRRGSDGKVYGQAGGQDFRLEGFAATPIAAAEVRAPAPANRLRDGRLIETAGDEVRITDPAGGRVSTRPFSYEGSPLQVFRLGWGPDDALYGSAVLPAHFFRLEAGDGRIVQLGRLGGGEVYAFLRHGEQLLAAAYSGLAPLMRYRPERPFAPGETAEANPVLLHHAGEVSSWRPMAMVAGPDGKAYLGAVSGYGELGGPLVIWDPATDEVATFRHVVPDQSVVSLAVAGQLIVGGTTVAGGGGSHPTQTEAALFLWDPRTGRTLDTVVPVPGASEITDLIAAPDGRVFGIAGGATLFAFDPDSRRVVLTAALPFQARIYNSVALAADGAIWGLAAAGIFRIDPADGRATLVAEAPEPITAGFACDGRCLYFACGARVYRYRLPEGGGR